MHLAMVLLEGFVILLALIVVGGVVVSLPEFFGALFDSFRTWRGWKHNDRMFRQRASRR